MPIHKNKQNIHLFLENIFSQNSVYAGEEEVFRQQLRELVQMMVDRDFPQLIQLLYRLDVSERDLKWKLRAASLEQSIDIIVDAIVERLDQKREMRKLFPSKDVDNIPEDERW